MESDDENKGDSNCKQLHAVESLNPNLNPNPIKKTVNKFTYSPDFEAFWEKSSKRGNKFEAHEEWLKIKPDAELQQQMALSMAKARASPEWRDAKFIPHVCRWLKKRGWENEYGPTNVLRMPDSPTPVC